MGYLCEGSGENWLGHTESWNEHLTDSENLILLCVSEKYMSS